MDGSKFDELAQRLASSRSRRQTLKLAAAGILGGAGFSRLDTANAAANKVTICHFTSSATNPYNIISVSANALPAHQGHGDFVYGDCCLDSDCSEGDFCEEGTCVTPGCAGGGCEGAPTCNDTGSCVCFTTVEGDGFCHLGQSCSETYPCDDSGDCSNGWRCVAVTCCFDSGPICIQPCPDAADGGRIAEPPTGPGTTTG